MLRTYRIYHDIVVCVGMAFSEFKENLEPRSRLTMILTPNTMWEMRTYTWSLTPGMRKRAVDRRSTIRAVEVWPCLIPAQKDTYSVYEPFLWRKSTVTLCWNYSKTISHYEIWTKKVSLRRKMLWQKHCCGSESGSGSFCRPWMPILIRTQTFDFSKIKICNFLLNNNFMWFNSLIFTYIFHLKTS